MQIKLVFFLAALLVAQCLSTNAQLKLKERIRYTVQNDTIINSFIDNNSQEYFRIAETKEGIKKIPSGMHRGLQYIERQQRIIFENNNDKKFNKNEIVIDGKNGTLLTKQPDFANDNTILRSYQVKDNAIIQNGVLENLSPESSFTVLENGFIIASDESEGYGTYQNILSSRFEVVNTYCPSVKGFTNSVTTSNNGKIVSAFKVIGEEGFIRIAIFNSYTGKVLNEGSVRIESNPLVIQSFKEYILLHTSDQLLYCINLNGTIVWSQKYDIPNFDLFNNNKDEVFVFTNDELVSIDVDTGFLKWKKELKELNNTNRRLEKHQMLRPTYLTIDEDLINVIVSVADNGTLNYTDVKYDNTLNFIDKSGQLKGKIQLSEKASELKIRNTKKGIQIIQNQELLSYEK
jgi:hypothetical protein